MPIKQLRESTGFSQDKFAALAHIPAGTIQNWEQGTRKPPEYILFLIEQYLKSLQKQLKGADFLSAPFVFS